ncbi:neprilysin-1 [Lucilia sericata]|uniref:neprilysin-1 n=1 Tax=Lucilia sericata TaxID=13632 RepID=UPI0018A8136B|nr:neprilysin-1 [Lucilia sericata]
MLSKQLITFASTLLWALIAAKPTKPAALITAHPYAVSPATLNANELAYWEHLNKTCLTRDCDEHVNVKHLQHIATHMNRAINPCENFHAYACSNWQQQHPDQQTVMAMGEQQLNDKFEQIFTTADVKLRGDLIKHKMQQYLEVCLQSESKEKASWRQYIITLREMGYLQFNNQSNWLQTLRELNLFSNSRFFISLQIERFNATRYMLSIDPHNLMERVKFSQEIYDILQIYSNDSFAKLEMDFRNLELDLENILKTSCLNAIVDENNECDLTEWLSYKELVQTNTTSINWEYLLADFTLEPSDQIFVNDLLNIEKIKTYLDNSSQKTLFLYALTRFINYLQSHTHNIIDKGSDHASCLRHMRKHFPLAMNYLYEQVYYAPTRTQSDEVIMQVYTQLKEQFSLILDRNEMQLSSDSIQYLKKKLKYLALNIGNLPKNASGHFYLEYIADLNVTQNFYVNHLMSLKHFFQHQRLLASPSKFDSFWFTFNLHMPNFLDNLDSTPYYFSTANFIILPFAYLQLPFYDHRFWPSLLFGDLANTLGHELIHAFDSKFLENDYAGNYNDIDSLAIINNKNFQHNIACLSKQPTKYLTERIADISGTHLALRTFIKDPLFLKHNGKLFFLQFAQFFCGSSQQETFALTDDSHDLDSLRLNYTLSHMPEFAEVFQCPLGSPMNPVEKCKLW